APSGSAGSSWTVRVTGSDPSGASASASFSLSVDEINLETITTEIVGVLGDRSDASIRSDLVPTSVRENTLRAGGVSPDYNNVAVLAFKVPALTNGSAISDVNLTVKLKRISSIPAGSVDLYGLATASNADQGGGSYFTGTFAEDLNETVWPIQDDFISNDQSSGNVTTSSDAGLQITAFLMDHMLRNHDPESLVYFRLNSDEVWEDKYRFWELHSADSSGSEPVLTMDISTGYLGGVRGNPIQSPLIRSVHLENSPITFSLEQSVASEVLDSDEVIWHSSIDGEIGQGTSKVVSFLSVGVHEITVTWISRDGAFFRYHTTVEVDPESSLPSVENSLSKGAVTWYFDKAYLTGRFINGDHYVVAPSGLTITRITPDWDGSTNGSELNPLGGGRGSRQGFDKNVSNTEYDPLLNIADDLPLFIAANSSVVSSVGRRAVASNGRPIYDVAVLTVLSEEPPVNSFRPPYAGTDKRIIGNKFDIDYSFLRSLQDPEHVQNPRGEMSHVLLDLISQWQNSDLKTDTGLNSYGRQIAYGVADTMLWLNLDRPISSKQTVFENVIQRGIDVYGSVKSGLVYAPNGGHNHGRKLLLVTAARALGDSEMLEWSDAQKHLVFQEDMQTFIVTRETLSRNSSYTESHLGMPEWASNPITELEDTTSAWVKPYRDVNGGPNTGVVLAAELMGFRQVWNHEPLFRYIEERYWPAEESNRATALNQIYHFYADLWELHKP
ncbi:hypothetical protein, partial [Pelagicoccus sp. SDUM812002]|uniref:hypothetical protein n=1 Tax=Pelagicoccus sp. SDUM812002 TaxID=3041266 RepID=UPI00280FCFFE